MLSMEDKIRKNLEVEASRWVEEELTRRLEFAKEAIDHQASVSADVCRPESVRKHVLDANVLAEEGIRQELEMEASAWVEDEMKKRAQPFLEDQKLESDWC